VSFLARLKVCLAIVSYYYHALHRGSLLQSTFKRSFLALDFVVSSRMNADGWRTRKRKADTPASDLATARARAEVSDVQHAEKKFRTARARKFGRGADIAVSAGVGAGTGTSAGSAAGSAAPSSPAKRAKTAHEPGRPHQQLELERVETKVASS
jgi:hypothetical protein